MFDKYAGDNKTELPPEQKFYFGEDGKTLVLPTINIFSFLAAQNTTSCAKKFGSKKWRDLAGAFLSFVQLKPELIPFLRKGKPIKFTKFDDKGIYVHRAVARLPKGIANPKVRPVLSLPWSLTFELSMYENDYFQEVLLRQMFDKGGLVIGFGSYRPVFGKFVIGKWE